MPALDCVDLNTLSLPDLFATLMRDGRTSALLRLAADEDLAAPGDVTSAAIIEPDQPGKAAVVMRTGGVVAGLAALPLVRAAFQCDGPDGVQIDVRAEDGQRCDGGVELARLRGRQRDMLAMERTLLNTIGRLCGIATLTRAYVDQVATTRAVICDTRKTTPGWRALEKYAARCGGATLHRLGLYDAALFKDNHLAHLPRVADDGSRGSGFARAVAEAARRVRSQHALRFVEVEVDTLAQLQALLDVEPGLIDIIMLDNMDPVMLERAVRLRDAQQPGVQLEASGGITLQTVRDVATTGVDRISIGALTHSATSLDIGLDMCEGNRDEG